MFGLIPKEEKFFEMFREAARNVVQGAEVIREMLDTFENPNESYKKIKDLEHKGDQITHDVIEKLNKSFITPLDREDIYSLAGALDDVLDLIDAAAVRFVMYHVSKTTSEARQFGYLIYKGAQALERGVEALTQDDPVRIKEFCVEANDLENEADRVFRDAISKLFEEEKDPIQLIKWKEIYETLERVTDKVEDAANILESVVVKNA